MNNMNKEKNKYDKYDVLIKIKILLIKSICFLKNIIFKIILAKYILLTIILDND